MLSHCTVSARVALLFAWCVLLGCFAPSAKAFSGEDILLGNPYYHQVITQNAALRCGFAPSAADTLKWHADYIDSYNYNPLWWAQGGISRLKVSLATRKELEKLHFDDLFSTLAVEANMSKILTGTLLGLLWAKEQNDVSAAHNILGVSLHAIQDFYSHSNWVDDPSRRTRTWFDVPLEERRRMTIWTGSYEQPAHLGIKPHGKIEPMFTLLEPAAPIMNIACAPMSPLSNSELCRIWRARETRSVPAQVLGVQVPNNVVYLAPPGIALDNRWLSRIAVQVRGVTDVTGEELFNVALQLAERASVQWLLILEREMKVLGAEEFWNRIKSTGFGDGERRREFEDYRKMAYTFVSAGAYPTPPFRPAGTEEVFLRVRLKTASQTGYGTDADIILQAGNEQFLLDYAPYTNVVLAVNDFEAGDDMVYTVGPLSSLPDSITLRNRAATGWDVVAALGKEFKDRLEASLSAARTR